MTGVLLYDMHSGLYSCCFVTSDLKACKCLQRSLFGGQYYCLFVHTWLTWYTRRAGTSLSDARTTLRVYLMPELPFEMSCNGLSDTPRVSVPALTRKVDCFP
jgi:hypothetical protein